MRVSLVREDDERDFVTVYGIQRASSDARVPFTGGHFHFAKLYPFSQSVGTQHSVVHDSH